MNSKLKASVEDFHRQRRMFVVMPDRFQARLQFAPEGDLRSHAEWLFDVYGIKEPCLRGYVDETGLWFYSSADCNATEEDRVRIWGLLREIGEYLDLSESTEIHMGTVSGPPGSRWPARKNLGTFRSLGL